MVVAVTALVAALTFGASMQHLVANPRLFGWTWNVALVDGSGYGNTKPAATEAAFAANPDIEAWAALYGGTDVNGSNIPVLGMDPSSVRSRRSSTVVRSSDRARSCSAPRRSTGSTCTSETRAIDRGPVARRRHRDVPDDRCGAR